MRVELCVTIRVGKRVMNMATVGHPRLWKTPEELEKAISGFWEHCEKNKDIPDVEGLAFYLGTSRKILNEYEKREEYSTTVKKAKTRIAHEKKQLAMKGVIPAAVFCFDFKNNHEYVDKIEHVNTNVDVQVEPDEELIEKIKKKYVRDVIL
jgi:hypothetical protein